jgi:hypothetical protein
MGVWICGKRIQIIVIYIFIWRITGTTVIYQSRRSRFSASVTFIASFILKVHWVVCLVIQKTLSLEEILSPLESALLLHLLKRILIILQNITGTVAILKTLSAILIIVV